MERTGPAAGHAAFVAAVVTGLLFSSAGYVRAQAAPAAPIAPAAAVPAPAAAQPATAFPPAQATIPSRSDYRIRQGDEVTLTVFGEPTLTPGVPLRVMQGGSVTVPLVGNVPISGQTTLQASHTIAKRLRVYLRDPQVTVAIYSVGPVEALILGNVRTPGNYTLPPPARLTDVLAAAGGLGPTDGDFPEARLEAPDGTVTRVSLQKLLHDGDTTLNTPLVSGETVYIPAPSTFNVRVIGAVDKPGDVALHDGDDLAMAVARAGTSTQQNVDLNHVTVTRVGADGKANAQTIDLYGILKRGDLSHDLVMQKNDLVYVPSSASHNIGGAASVLILLRALIP
jgi:polysaccharide export outer membrane protein